MTDGQDHVLSQADALTKKNIFQKKIICLPPLECKMFVTRFGLKMVVPPPLYVKNVCDKPKRTPHRLK